MTHSCWELFYADLTQQFLECYDIKLFKGPVMGFLLGHRLPLLPLAGCSRS